MGVSTYFFDTYALREIILGSEDYKRYALHAIIITSKFQLMEMHYGLLKDNGKEIADHFFDYFKSFVVEVDDDIIKRANEFKLKSKKTNLSYVDCIGFTIARMRGIPFLTGDNAFKGMEGVEFVK